MSSNPSTIKKRFLTYLTIFFTSILVGEIINTIHNKPPYLVPFFLKKTHSHANNNQTQQSLKFLKLATNFYLHESKKQHPQLQLDPSFPPLSPSQQTTLTNLLLKPTYQDLPSHYHNLLPKLFYEFGLTFHPQNPQLTQNLFELATALGPRWIFFHLELTNLYHQQGKLQKAQNQLNSCSNFETIQGSCKTYLQKSISQKIPKKVGFLQRKISQDIN